MRHETGLTRLSALLAALPAALYRLGQNHVLSAGYYYPDAVGRLDSSAGIAPARRLDPRYAFRLTGAFSLELVVHDPLEDYEPENLHERPFHLRLSGGF